MNFVKGMVIGMGITVAAYMMYTEGMLNKRKMMKQAKRLACKIGIN